MKSAWRFFVWLCLLLVNCGSPSAYASVRFSYTGSEFQLIIDSQDGGLFPAPETYSSLMRLSGEFTLAQALDSNLPLGTIAPLTFSYFDGRQTFTNATAGLVINRFEVATTSSGEISEWLIDLRVPYGLAQNMNIERSIVSQSVIGNERPTQFQGVIPNPPLGRFNGDYSVMTYCPSLSEVGGCLTPLPLFDRASSTSGGAWSNVASPVPEPSLGIMLAFGLVSLLGWCKCCSWRESRWLSEWKFENFSQSRVRA